MKTTARATAEVIGQRIGRLEWELRGMIQDLRERRLVTPGSEPDRWAHQHDAKVRGEQATPAAPNSP